MSLECKFTGCDVTARDEAELQLHYDMDANAHVTLLQVQLEKSRSENATNKLAMSNAQTRCRTMEQKFDTLMDAYSTLRSTLDKMMEALDVKTQELTDLRREFQETKCDHCNSGVDKIDINTAAAEAEQATAFSSSVAKLFAGEEEEHVLNTVIAKYALPRSVKSSIPQPSPFGTSKLLFGSPFTGTTIPMASTSEVLRKSNLFPTFRSNKVQTSNNSVTDSKKPLWNEDNVLFRRSEDAIKREIKGIEQLISAAKSDSRPAAVELRKNLEVQLSHLDSHLNARVSIKVGK